MELEELSMTIHFDGQEYYDDRLFVLELAQVTTRSLTRSEAPRNRWAVITRRNIPGYSPFRSDDFGTREEAIQFLHQIAPTTPRISLGGKSPTPEPTLPEYRAWLLSSGLEALPE